MASVVIDYRPRPHQKVYHNSNARWRLPIWHRRAGKTVAVVNDLTRDCLRATTFMPAVAYIAPLRNQAKRVAWPVFEHFTKDIPGVRYDRSELVVHLPGQRRMFCLGSDNPDAIRGIGLDAAALDETAQIDPYAWYQVIRPAMAERKGRATFIGTPKGRMNLLHEMWEFGSRGRGWWRQLLKASESGVLPKAELADIRKMLSEDEYEQEMECSFNAAITGAYYAKEMAQADGEGRIMVVRHDKRFPVYAALDLGWSDLTVAWYYQKVGTEVRVLASQAWHHTALADVVGDMRAQPWPIYQVVAPHDIKVTELGSGSSRQEVLWSLGVNHVIAPKMSIEDGREAVRELLPRCVFDREGCGVGIEALVQYRTDYDSLLKVYGTKHVHDWCSHYADAFRYLSVSLPFLGDAMPERVRRKDAHDRYRQVI